MGLRVENESCTCCGDKHVTVWLVIAGFKRLCGDCFEHYMGHRPEDEPVRNPEVAQ